MKVRFHGESDPLTFVDGKIYDVMAVEGDDKIGPWYRIVLETGDDYIYPADGFEVMEA